MLLVRPSSRADGVSVHGWGLIGVCLCRPCLFLLVFFLVFSVMRHGPLPRPIHDLQFYRRAKLILMSATVKEPIISLSRPRCTDSYGSVLIYFRHLAEFPSEVIFVVLDDAEGVDPQVGNDQAPTHPNSVLNCSGKLVEGDIVVVGCFGFLGGLDGLVAAPDVA